jgi:hypothetical protein
VRTKEERLDGIEISSDFCLALAVNETYIGAKEQEAVPKAGFRLSGRSFRGIQKASSLGSGLVRIPPAFGPQNTGKRDSHLVRGVPTGSDGQSGETSQSRDFPVRGSQSFQGVRKRLRDLGSNETTPAGSIPAGPAKLVICELFTSISKDSSQQSISMTSKSSSRSKGQPARNETAFFWPSLESIALILILQRVRFRFLLFR